jgi:hypothetical protein
MHEAGVVHDESTLSPPPLDGEGVAHSSVRLEGTACNSLPQLQSDQHGCIIHTLCSRAAGHIGCSGTKKAVVKCCEQTQLHCLTTQRSCTSMPIYK